MGLISLVLTAIAAVANAYAAWLKDDLANKPQERLNALMDAKDRCDKDVAAARAAGNDALAQRLLDNWAIRSGGAVNLPAAVPASGQGSASSH